MQKDLFLAVLAMDVYNRGSYVSVVTTGDRIGNAEILPDSEQRPETSGGLSAGFYATAYDMSTVVGYSAGEKVIAFRGTDTKLALPWSDVGSDISNGYGVFFGSPDGPQAELARRFYTAVTGNGFHDATPGVLLTGHSLGGGLAGFIASVSGSSAVVFDPMPFADAARTAAGDTEPQFNRITGDFTSGEFLQALRALPTTNNPDLGLTEFDTHSSVLNAAVSLLDPIERHSEALLVDLIYARDLADQSWQAAAPYLWEAYFGKEAASEINDANALRGDADGSTADDALRTAVAYSAIDEGTKPFGDTALPAMFNDANNLGAAEKAGTALNELTVNLTPKPIASLLAESSVQYAGELAFHRIDLLDARPDGLTPAESGMLSLSATGA